MYYSTVVSAKFVFGTDIKVVSECTEEYEDFVREVGTVIEMFNRVMVELPLYKLYDNKLSQDFKRSLEVSVINCNL